MASGRERSESIFTLFHLVFHRCEPVEYGIKEKEDRSEKAYPNVFLLTCSVSHNCFDMVESRMCV